MNKIILWYNKNRKLIWSTIITFLVMILLVQLLRYINTRNKIAGQINNEIDTNIDINSNLNAVKLDSGDSAVLGEEIGQSQINNVTAIDEFVASCNNGEVNAAYNLLSEECKEEMYPTLEVFTNSYYNQVFNGMEKSVSVENWVNNTYKVIINEDVLSTGNYTNENQLQDYISIVFDEQGNRRLNINNYIGRAEKTVVKETEELKIELLEINTYMDYQTYKFNVTNNTENTIVLDDMKLDDSMYLEDENGIRYPSYMHEISEQELTLTAKQTKEIEIKYYNKYSSTKEMVSVNFSRIQLTNDIGNEINVNPYRYFSIKIEF